MTAENESIFDICSKVYQEILRRDNHKEQQLVLKTGFKDIDRKMQKSILMTDETAAIILYG